MEAEVDVAAEKDEVDSDEPQNVDDSDASDNESEDGDASSEESGEDDSGSEGDKVPIPEHVPSAAPVLHAKPTIKMAKVTRHFCALGSVQFLGWQFFLSQFKFMEHYVYL